MQADILLLKQRDIEIESANKDDLATLKDSMLLPKTDLRPIDDPADKLQTSISAIQVDIHKLKQQDSEIEAATKADLAAIRVALPSPDTAIASAETMDNTRRLIDCVHESLRKDIVHCKSTVAIHLVILKLYKTV